VLATLTWLAVLCEGHANLGLVALLGITLGASRLGALLPGPTEFCRTTPTEFCRTTPVGCAKKGDVKNLSLDAVRDEDVRVGAE
jgi:hypothetical protein